MASSRPSTADKRRTFKALHQSGCFVIPNPWNVGTARYLQGLGFKALASTSSGFAWSQARSDNGVGRDTVLGHLRELVAATDLPVNADFENGFGADPAAVAESVRLRSKSGLVKPTAPATALVGPPSRPAPRERRPAVPKRR